MLRIGKAIRFRLAAILLAHWGVFVSQHRKWDSAGDIRNGAQDHSLPHAGVGLSHLPVSELPQDRNRSSLL
jgi:hypothetical protein